MHVRVVMEILVEFKQHRIVLSLSLEMRKNDFFDFVEREIRKYEKNVSLLGSSSSSRRAGSSCAILQKWSEKWNCYVDIEGVEGIVDGDRLIIVPKCPTTEMGVNVSIIKLILNSVITVGTSFSCTSYQELGSKASALVSTLKKPGEGSVKVLRDLFPSSLPSSSTASMPLKRPFDPLEEFPQRKKKSKSLRMRVKPSKITVLFIKDVEKGIPKGKARREINRMSKYLNSSVICLQMM